MPKKKPPTSTVNPEQVEAWMGTIGATVRNRREKKSMNQTGLAESAGVSRGTISSLENGREGTAIGALIRSLLVLDVDVWELFGGKRATRPAVIEKQFMHDLVDELFEKGSEKLRRGAREILQGFVSRC